MILLFLVDCTIMIYLSHDLVFRPMAQTHGMLQHLELRFSPIS